MRDLEKSIAHWREELMRTGIERAELLDELESHLRQKIDQLTATGISESDAFLTATRELGNATALKHEFSKVTETRPWTSRIHWLAINFIALWFIFSGVNQLTVERGLYDDFSRALKFFTLPAISGRELCIYAYSFITGSFLLMLGVGLYRRKNFWRVAALIWVFWNLIVSAVRGLANPDQILRIYRYAPHIKTVPNEIVRYEIATFSTPYWLFHTYAMVGLPVLLLTLFVLTRPSVRGFFKPAPKLKSFDKSSTIYV